MAKPRDSYPETATNSARKTATNENGDAVLQETLTAHGEDLTDLLTGTEELENAFTTAILIAASVNEDDLDYITASTSNVIEAVNGLSTEEAAALATELGNNADDLSVSLDTVLTLQREGHLDDLVTITTAFAESLSTEEVDELSSMLEENGSEIVEALDVVLDLQRDGHLDDLVGLAKTLSVLDIDEDAATGLNTLLNAVGETQRESEPTGPLGFLGQLRDRDARVGLGYLVGILKALGRQLRNR